MSLGRIQFALFLSLLTWQIGPAHAGDRPAAPSLSCEAEPTLALLSPSPSNSTHSLWTLVDQMDFPSFRSFIRFGSLFSESPASSALFGSLYSFDIASAADVPEVVTGTQKLANSIITGSFLQAGAWQLKVDWQHIGVSLKF